MRRNTFLAAPPPRRRPDNASGAWHWQRATQIAAAACLAVARRAIDPPNFPIEPPRQMRAAQGLKSNAMKPDTHPDYHLVKVVMTDGTEFTTRTTWGKSGDTLHLDVDPKSHPAWTGGQQHLARSRRPAVALPEEVFGLSQEVAPNAAICSVRRMREPARFRCDIAILVRAFCAGMSGASSRLRDQTPSRSNAAFNRPICRSTGIADRDLDRRRRVHGRVEPAHLGLQLGRARDQLLKLRPAGARSIWHRRGRRPRA